VLGRRRRQREEEDEELDAASAAAWPRYSLFLLSEHTSTNTDTRGAADSSLATQSLGISAYGITCTSLEDVFLRICEGAVDVNNEPPLPHAPSVAAGN
jgi:hypothetical protein